MPTPAPPPTLTPNFNRKQLFAALRALAESSGANLHARLSDLYADNAQWRGSHPLNTANGIHEIAHTAWQPLLAAMPDLERRDDLFVGGSYEGRDYIAATGHFCGTFSADWLGIPATGRPVWLRYGEVHQIIDGQIVQSNCLWDILDLMRQAGIWPLPPSLGAEVRWPGPQTADGIVLHATDPTQSAASIAQTLAMHKTLGDYNDQNHEGRDGLLNMPQKQHWHPKMMWYGPAGIGTTRALAGFVDHHQLPFRIAFPNRKGGGQWDDVAEAKKKHSGGHYIRIGDGPFSVTGGWPSVHALHQGGGFLGTAPTGRAVTMRVMDFYAHHEGRIRENWVPLDIIDLLLQMDVDLFDRMHHYLRR